MHVVQLLTRQPAVARQQQTKILHQYACTWFVDVCTGLTRLLAIGYNVRAPQTHTHTLTL